MEGGRRGGGRGEAGYGPCTVEEEGGGREQYFLAIGNIVETSSHDLLDGKKLLI